MNENDKKIEQRMNRIIGQLEGIKKMMTANKNCIDVLTQFKAANSALESTTKEFAKIQIKSCFKGLDQDKKDLELEKLLSSLIK